MNHPECVRCSVPYGNEGQPFLFDWGGHDTELESGAQQIGNISADKKYGSSGPLLKLGNHSLRSALRYVYQQWVSAHAKRALAAEQGVHIEDPDFNRYLNQRMSAAVCHVSSGLPEEHAHETLRGYSHPVDLATAEHLLEERAQQLGLKGHLDVKKHDSFCIASTSKPNLNTRVENMSDVSRKEIKAMLATALRAELVKHEEFIRETSAKEAAGVAKLEKNASCGDMEKNAMMGYGPKVPGGTSPGIMKDERVPGMSPDFNKDAPDDTATAALVCPGCGAESMHVGDMGDRAHFLCVGGCGLGFSGPREENAEAHVDDPLVKVTPPDISEETAHKIKAEYGGDKSKAYATMWAIHNKKKRDTKKSEPKESEEHHKYVASGDHKGRCATCGENFSDIAHHPGKKVGDFTSFSAWSGGKPGTSYSVPVTNSKATKKSEPSPNGYSDAVTGEATPAKGPGKLPDTEGKKAGSKEIKAEGSGGDIEKGKLKKDATDMAFGVSRKPTKMAAPKLPGMTPDPKAPTHPEVLESIRQLKALRPGGSHPSVGQAISEAKEMRHQMGHAPTLEAAPPAPGEAPQFVDKGGKALPFVKKPTMADPEHAAAVKGKQQEFANKDAANLAADKRAAGVGFLNSLISKFRGLGNKTWEAARGAGANTPGAKARLGRATATRMALAEKGMEKTTAEEANKEIQGFKSVASNPTAMPGTKPKGALKFPKKSAASVRGTPSTGIKVPEYLKEELPFEKVIRKESGGYDLKTHDGKRTLGHHKTKGEALAQERAIEASKHSLGKAALPGTGKPAGAVAPAAPKMGANPTAPSAGAKPAGVAAPSMKPPKMPKA